ncbi:MAG: hypothetical protein ACK55I_16180, partial [bacterium]
DPGGLAMRLVDRRGWYDPIPALHPIEDAREAFDSSVSQPVQIGEVVALARVHLAQDRPSRSDLGSVDLRIGGRCAFAWPHRARVARKERLVAQRAQMEGHRPQMRVERRLIGIHAMPVHVARGEH